MLFEEESLGVIYQKTGFTSQSGYFVLKYDGVKYKMYRVGLKQVTYILSMKVLN